MEKQKFEMVAKTFAGLEEVLAEELRNLGAENVEPGRRMVSFEGDLEMMYKANLCCRTALRILKPFYKFTASDPDTLYEMVKEFDWGSLLSVDKTFSIDAVVNSDDFTHSRFVTYRVKDAIADWFTDRYGAGKRPGVRLEQADAIINVHITDNRVTLSLDSSGESLHKRGWRVAQTEAPINEVLAAGIILLSGWRGESPFVDPMCGSGTFLVEAAMIAANINPGVYRKHFAFELWPDFDRELFEQLYNDDSQERSVNFPIIGADMSPAAVEIATRNIKSAGLSDMIEVEVKPLSHWTEAPENGVLVTNPPYGERIKTDDMEGLYKLIGTKLKNVFKGYHAWIIGYNRDYFDAIGLAASQKIPLYNGQLECELREYIIFEGDMKSFKKGGGKLHDDIESDSRQPRKDAKKKFKSDRQWADEARRNGFGGRRGDDDKKKPFKKEHRRFDDDDFDSDSRRGGFKGKAGRKKEDFDRRRGDRRGDDKPSRFNRDDKFGRRDKFNREDKFKREERFDREERFNEDNPLASRRNEHALKSISFKKPSLPPTQGPVMRSRGWKKKNDQ